MESRIQLRRYQVHSCEGQSLEATVCSKIGRPRKRFMEDDGRQPWKGKNGESFAKCQLISKFFIWVRLVKFGENLFE